MQSTIQKNVISDDELEIMTECSNILRRDGINELEEVIVKNKLKMPKIFYQAMLLVCDGTKPGIIRNICYPPIAMARDAGKYDYSWWLQAWLDAAIDIAQGYDPRLIREHIGMFNYYNRAEYDNI
jgi:flagellar motor component MotA